MRGAALPARDGDPLCDGVGVTLDQGDGCAPGANESVVAIRTDPVSRSSSAVALTLNGAKALWTVTVLAAAMYALAGTLAIVWIGQRRV